MGRTRPPGSPTDPPVQPLAGSRLEAGDVSQHKHGSSKSASVAVALPVSCRYPPEQRKQQK